MDYIEHLCASESPTVADEQLVPRGSESQPHEPQCCTAAVAGIPYGAGATRKQCNPLHDRLFDVPPEAVRTGDNSSKPVGTHVARQDRVEDEGL